MTLRRNIMQMVVSKKEYKVEAEKVEAEKVEAEKVEAKKVEAEKVEAEKVEAEKVEAEKLASNSPSKGKGKVSNFFCLFDHHPFSMQMVLKLVKRWKKVAKKQK